MAALPSSQAIVVLSGMRVEPPGDAPLGEWSEAVDRFEAGMALFQAGKAPVLVCTGARIPWYPEARPEGEILAERAAALGVPHGQMLVTDKVTNTADEARAVARHLQEQRSTTPNAQIILVTSAFHMRRARVLFARAGFQVVPFPVDFHVSVGRTFTMLDLLPTASSLSKTELALREWYGFLFYQPAYSSATAYTLCSRPHPTPLPKARHTCLSMVISSARLWYHYRRSHHCVRRSSHA